MSAQVFEIVEIGEWEYLVRTFDRDTDDIVEGNEPLAIVPVGGEEHHPRAINTHLFLDEAQALVDALNRAIERVTAA